MEDNAHRLKATYPQMNSNSEACPHAYVNTEQILFKILQNYPKTDPETEII